MRAQGVISECPGRHRECSRAALTKAAAPRSRTFQVILLRILTTSMHATLKRYPICGQSAGSIQDSRYYFSPLGHNTVRDHSDLPIEKCHEIGIIESTA